MNETIAERAAVQVYLSNLEQPFLTPKHVLLPSTLDPDAGISGYANDAAGYAMWGVGGGLAGGILGRVFNRDVATWAKGGAAVGVAAKVVGAALILNYMESM